MAYANEEENVAQVILIGDAPAKSVGAIAKTIERNMEENLIGINVNLKLQLFYVDEMKKLASKKVFRFMLSMLHMERLKKILEKLLVLLQVVANFLM